MQAGGTRRFSARHGRICNPFPSPPQCGELPRGALRPRWRDFVTIAHGMSLPPLRWDAAHRSGQWLLHSLPFAGERVHPLYGLEPSLCHGLP